ncbi:hypothetical protein LUX39_02795 [Actinomadura madurae]|nr:hypothetical protein [Actinomadura madurae]MCP9976726.1 hypothetical protein [Actinomadura madurae]MCQ0012913.1 hypothetical protein [Actinomadura madurae]
MPTAAPRSSSSSWTIAASRSDSPMSRPATYRRGISCASARTNDRRIASRSGDAGSAAIPAFAPPKNRSTPAHL